MRRTQLMLTLAAGLLLSCEKTTQEPAHGGAPTKASATNNANASLPILVYYALPG